MTIVETRAETRAITGGVDTHADVHIAAALDPIGGLLGVREFPATTMSQPLSCRSATAPASAPVTRYRDLFPAGAARPACRTAAGPGETSVLRSARGITGLGASAAWPCPSRRDP